MSETAPLRLLLDGSALVANWRWLAARNPGAACGAAVKADGYGLGARDVVARLAAAGCGDFFCATWAEAAALGAMPGGARLAVLHGVRAEDMAQALRSPARPVLNSVEQVVRWRGASGGACDVMVDTGMNRVDNRDELEAGLRALGYRYADLERIIVTHHHVDHFGLASVIVEQSDAEVVALDGLVGWLRD